MQAPEFWNHASGRLSAPVTRAALEPLSWMYQAGTMARAGAITPFRPAAPVICVGNITMGGTGKTPVSIALIKRLLEKGITAHALSRGYGGKKRGPIKVDLNTDTHHEVGDEALLLARAGTTWVSKTKTAGARAAAQAGADVIIMDDGLQNPTVVKDASLVLIDGTAGLGNGRVFPAGPLREGVRSALRRADAVIVVGGDENEPQHEVWRKHKPVGVPVLHANLVARGPIPQGPVFAFAGIGRPEKFFSALRETGADLKATAPYPDHHAYTDADLKELRERARRHNALLITTEKDYVRINKDLRRIIHAWPVAAEFDQPEHIDAIIDRAMDRAVARR